jgi:hypothetical protein
LVLADYAVWNNLAQYVPPLVLAIALLAFVWSLAQRRWEVSALSIWVAVLAAIVAGRLIHLPGSNMMQSFAILIALYMPVGLLAGWLIGQLVVWVEQRRAAVGSAMAAVFIVSGAAWGAWDQRLIEQPTIYAMVSRPDIRAMAWIRSHVPEEARFLVEGFRIFDGRSAVGSDAGWWIPMLAGRANSMPPQYALMNEKPLDAGYSKRVVELIAHLERTAPSSPLGAQLLCEWGITYVYVGQLQGLASMQKTQLYSPEELESSPYFGRVYNHDRVSIFELDSSTCPVPQ